MVQILPIVINCFHQYYLIAKNRRRHNNNNTPQCNNIIDGIRYILSSHSWHLTNQWRYLVFVRSKDTERLKSVEDFIQWFIFIFRVVCIAIAIHTRTNRNIYSSCNNIFHKYLNKARSKLRNSNNTFFFVFIVIKPL